MWSCLSFSQNLTPKVELIQSETHFCFTIPQSRSIAFNLASKIHADSIIVVMRKQQFQFKKLIAKKDTVIAVLQEKNINLNNIQRNNDKQVEELKYILKAKDKTLRKNKFQKKVVGIGLVVISGILIVNKI